MTRVDDTKPSRMMASNIVTKENILVIMKIKLI
jgi:hypothetical protein